jgi:hypothetical protein
MGEQTGLPRINEVAAYLNQYAPAVADRLKEQGGGIALLVEEGVVGGDQTVEDHVQRTMLNQRAVVVEQALTSALTDCRVDATSATSRLRRLKVVRFVSSVFAAIGSSSVIGATFVGAAATVAAGIVTLLATLSSLFADNVVLGSRDAEQILRDAAMTIQKLSGEAELTRRWLDALRSIEGYDTDQMQQVLSDANQLFHNLIEARAKIASTS